MHRNSLQKWAFRQWNLKKKFLPNNAKMAQKGPENQYKNYSSSPIEYMTFVKRNIAS